MVNLFGPLRTFIVRWTFIVFCTVNIFLVNRKRFSANFANPRVLNAEKENPCGIVNILLVVS